MPCGSEIVTDTFRLILVASLLEYRLVLHFSRGVGTSYGMNDAAVHVHRNPIGLQLQIGIIYLLLPYRLAFPSPASKVTESDAVIFYRLVEHRLAHFGGIFRHRISL